MTKEKKYGQKRYTKRKAKDFVDQDYLDTLDPTSAEFMDKFNKEYYQGDFRHEEPLHDTDKLRKDCYSKNNERLRDGWNKWIRTDADLIAKQPGSKTDRVKNRIKLGQDDKK